MDPDQGRHSVGPDLGPNYLQSLLADYKSHHYTTSKERITPLLLATINVQKFQLVDQGLHCLQFLRAFCEF